MEQNVYDINNVEDLIDELNNKGIPVFHNDKGSNLTVIMYLVSRIVLNPHLSNQQKDDLIQSLFNSDVVKQG